MTLLAATTLVGAVGRGWLRVLLGQVLDEVVKLMKLMTFVFRFSSLEGAHFSFQIIWYRDWSNMSSRLSRASRPRPCKRIEPIQRSEQ